MIKEKRNNSAKRNYTVKLLSKKNYSEGSVRINGSSRFKGSGRIRSAVV